MAIELWTLNAERKWRSFLCSWLERAQVSKTLAQQFCKSNRGICFAALVSKQGTAIRAMDV
jgi:hypothetical protein